MFWPRSLFGRLTLLLITVVAISLAATILVFRHERAALLERQFNDTKITQLLALRSMLESTDLRERRREQLEAIGRQYGVRIIPEGDRPRVGIMPVGPMYVELEARLTASLGTGTEVRLAPRS